MSTDNVQIKTQRETSVERRLNEGGHLMLVVSPKEAAWGVPSVQMQTEKSGTQRWTLRKSPSATSDARTSCYPILSHYNLVWHPGGRNSPMSVSVKKRMVTSPAQEAGRSLAEWWHLRWPWKEAGDLPSEHRWGLSRKADRMNRKAVACGGGSGQHFCVTV